MFERFATYIGTSLEDFNDNLLGINMLIGVYLDRLQFRLIIYLFLKSEREVNV